MDIIFIDDLRLSTTIGIYPREQALPQMIDLSLQIGCSTERAGRSDEIGDTIDYAVVVAQLRADLASRQFGLIEKLAEHIAQLILQDFKASWVRVSLAKLGMMRGVRRVGVIIERSAGSV
ncbi:MAG: dihydroneopterin aldolase [Pseudomonadota bacterium]